MVWEYKVEAWPWLAEAATEQLTALGALGREAVTYVDQEAQGHEGVPPPRPYMVFKRQRGGRGSARHEQSRDRRAGKPVRSADLSAGQDCVGVTLPERLSPHAHWSDPAPPR